MTDRKHPGVAFWATVVVVCLPLLYVLSFGPACWFGWPRYVSLDAIARVYQPILWTAHRSPQPVDDVISWYISLGLPDGSGFKLRENLVLKTTRL